MENQSKFDLNNLPDIRVHAKNGAEMKRVQTALFAAGYQWIGDDPKEYWYGWDYDYIITVGGEILNEPDWGGLTDLELPELEAIAAEKQKADRKELLGEIMQATPEQDDPTWGEFELGDIEKAKQEAKTDITDLALFIYQKDGTTKALPFREAKAEQEQLLADGWKHTATLNAAQFIQHLFNDCGGDGIVEAIYCLDGTKSREPQPNTDTKSDTLK